MPQGRGAKQEQSLWQHLLPSLLLLGMAVQHPSVAQGTPFELVRGSAGPRPGPCSAARQLTVQHPKLLLAGELATAIAKVKLQRAEIFHHVLQKTMWSIYIS